MSFSRPRIIPLEFQLYFLGMIVCRKLQASDFQAEISTGSAQGMAEGAVGAQHYMLL